MISYLLKMYTLYFMARIVYRHRNFELNPSAEYNLKTNTHGTDRNNSVNYIILKSKETISYNHDDYRSTKAKRMICRKKSNPFRADFPFGYYIKAHAYSK